MNRAIVTTSSVPTANRVVVRSRHHNWRIFVVLDAVYGRSVLSQPPFNRSIGYVPNNHRFVGSARHQLAEHGGKLTRLIYLAGRNNSRINNKCLPAVARTTCVHHAVSMAGVRFQTQLLVRIPQFNLFVAATRQTVFAVH